jgi:hypothetical protein
MGHGWPARARRGASSRSHSRNRLLLARVRRLGSATTAAREHAMLRSAFCLLLATAGGAAAVRGGSAPQAVHPAAQLGARACPGHVPERRDRRRAAAACCGVCNTPEMAEALRDAPSAPSARRAQAGAQSSEQALEQQIQALMTTSQNDHNAAVAIKTNTPGWLQGAPLAAEQADIAASQAALDQAEQLQLQLQARNLRLHLRRTPPEPPARCRRSRAAPPPRHPRAAAKPATHTVRCACTLAFCCASAADANLARRCAAWNCGPYPCTH